MACQPTRDWLLMGDEPADPAIRSHLDSCPACQRLAEEAAQLDQQWRGIPLPPNANRARERFLNRLPSPARTLPRTGRRKHQGIWAAAILMLFAGSALILFWPGETVEAHPDVVDQLIDWNLEMTEAPTPVDRKRIYQLRHDTFRLALKTARLDQGDRDFAERLLENGTWLAQHDDPIEELSRLHRLADDLLESVRQARDDVRKSDRIARQFHKVNVRGIDPGFERIRTEKIVDPDKRLKVIRLIRQDVDRSFKVIQMVEGAPDSAQKDLRRAIEGTLKREKLKKWMQSPHEGTVPPLNP